MSDKGIVDICKWTPTEAQLMIKAQFWTRMIHSWRDPASMSLKEICDLAGSKRIQQWAAKDGAFMEWFLNRDHARQKIAASVELAIDTLIEITQTKNMNPKEGGVTAASRVKAAESLLNYAGMSPPKQHEVSDKREAQKLRPEELKATLTGHVKKLLTQLPPSEVRELLEENTTDAIEED